METGYGTTSDTHKHNRENRQFTRIRIGILQSVPKFGQRKTIKRNTVGIPVSGIKNFSFMAMKLEFQRNETN